MLTIKNHRLVEGGLVQPYQRPNSPLKRPFDKTTGKFKPGMLEAVIVHFTAAGKDSSLRTLRGKPRVSVQIVIDEKGKIYQSLDFDEIAWHAGTSLWDGKEDWNHRSIGLELINNGPLTQVGDGYKSLFGQSVRPENVVGATHRQDASESFFWEKFPADQLDATYQLTHLLMETYGIKLILGHDDISPLRKIDPGPAFPMDAFRKALTEGLPEGESFSDSRTFLAAPIAHINTPGDSLSLRSKPMVARDTLIAKLPHKTEVHILDDQYEQSPRNGRQLHRWAKIQAKVDGKTMTGFVSKRYLIGELVPEASQIGSRSIFGEGPRTEIKE